MSEESPVPEESEVSPDELRYSQEWMDSVSSTTFPVVLSIMLPCQSNFTFSRLVLVDGFTFMDMISLNLAWRFARVNSSPITLRTLCWEASSSV